MLKTIIKTIIKTMFLFLLKRLLLIFIYKVNIYIIVLFKFVDFLFNKLYFIYF